MVKWQVREVDVEVKNERNCTSAPPPPPLDCCYGAGMDNVTFYVYRRGFRGNRISLRMMKSLLFMELSRNYTLKNLPCCKWSRNIEL
jgi:hypothetical protein